MQKLTFLMKLAFHEVEALKSTIKKQKQITKILITQDKKIEAEEINLAKLKGLMNDLLSGKVRVKV